MVGLGMLALRVHPLNLSLEYVVKAKGESGGKGT